MIKMRKANWIRLGILAFGFDGMFTLVMAIQKYDLNLIHQHMNSREIMTYLGLFIVLNLILVLYTRWEDKSERVEKALTSGYQEVKQINNGNRIYFRKDGTNYSFLEINPQGYTVNRKHYHQDDLEFIKIMNGQN